MTVPPRDPAGFTTELYRLPARYLRQRLSTASTVAHIGSFLAGAPFTGEIIPAAEGRYLIFRKTERIGNSGISKILFPERDNFLFLFAGHGYPPI